MSSPDRFGLPRRSFLLPLLGLLVLICGRTVDAQILWGGTSANSLTGVLNAAIIPGTTGTSPVTYTNVGGAGYDIVVTTSSLIESGQATLPWNNTPGWYFEGGAADRSGQAIPYSTVTFRFYQTGTTIPFGLTGVHFRFEDAETGERFRNFGYWDAHGDVVSASFLDDCIFAYASGSPVYHVSDQSVDTGIGYEGGTQEGKWIDGDMTALCISGFTFQAGRVDSNYGSVVMTFTDNGDIVVPTTELLIESGSDQNVSAGPDFLSSGSNAILSTASLTGTLAVSDATVTTGGTSQNIVLDENIVSGSGHSLTMTATQSIVPCASDINLTSTTGNAGSITLTAGGSVKLADMETVSSTGTSGVISATAGNDIDIENGVDSSAISLSEPGGDVTFQAGNSVTTDSIRTGGGGGIARGTPGNITVTASNSIQINAIYDDSGTADATQAILSATSIALGQDGNDAAVIQGTLYLEKPVSSSAAIVAVSGTLTGIGGVVFDTGTGVATIDTDATYTGQTHILSGTLDAQGNSLPNSDIFADDTGGFAPDVQVLSGSVSANSITVATYGSLDMAFYDGGGWDLLDLTGSANLAGIFNLTLPDGFSPGVGTTFQVMTFATNSGTFGSYQGVRFGDMVLQPVFSGTDMELVASDVASGASQPLQTVPPGGLFVPAGGYYDGLITTSTDPDAVFTAATIIGGTASADTTVTMDLDTTGTTGFGIPGLSGLVLDLNGTGADKFVIQLDYNEAAALAAVGDERNLFIASSDGSGPFENAVYANTDLPGESNDPTEIIGVYDPAADFHLGYYGVDTVNNRIWAVLDHNSFFGVGAPNLPRSLVGPAPATEPASHVMATTSELNAEVNPDGYSTTAVFEFGTDPALAGASVISGTCFSATLATFQPITTPVTGLTPNTTYYFRVDGIATSGTQYGTILSFTTPTPPTVTVAAMTPDAYEEGLVPGAFAISQTGSAEVQVQYTIGGSGTNGIRYTLSVGPRTIPFGDSSLDLNVTPIASSLAVGDQTATIALVPNSNYTIGISSSATVTIHDTPENLWKLSNFGANANTPTISGDLVANNNAGIQNLMTYALGLNPLTTTAAGLPAQGSVTVSGSGYLTLDFTRNADASDITYTVQGSSDLLNWTTVSTCDGGVWSPSANVLETGSAPAINVQVQDSVPESSAPQRFLRLQITH